MVWPWLLLLGAGSAYLAAVWKAYRDHPLLAVAPGEEVLTLGPPHDGDRQRGGAGSVRFPPGCGVRLVCDLEMVPGYRFVTWGTGDAYSRTLVSLWASHGRGWKREIAAALTSRLGVVSLTRRAFMLHEAEAARIDPVRSAHGLEGWRVRKDRGPDFTILDYHMFTGQAYLHLSVIGPSAAVEALEPDRLAAGVEEPEG